MASEYTLQQQLDAANRTYARACEAMGCPNGVLLQDLPRAIAVLVKKYKSLIKWYDDHEGTPCEQIRHEFEIEKLQEELAFATRLADAYTVASGVIFGI